MSSSAKTAAPTSETPLPDASSCRYIWSVLQTDLLCSTDHPLLRHFKTISNANIKCIYEMKQIVTLRARWMIEWRRLKENTWSVTLKIKHFFKYNLHLSDLLSPCPPLNTTDRRESERSEYLEVRSMRSAGLAFLVDLHNHFTTSTVLKNKQASIHRRKLSAMIMQLWLIFHDSSFRFEN